MSPDGKGYMMPPSRRATAAADLSINLAAEFSWQAQWRAVPDEWKSPVYQIDRPGFRDVFLQNKYYVGAPRDLGPQRTPERFGQEIAWWVWLCWNDGLYKLEPSLVRWLSDAITGAYHDYTAERGHVPASITDLSSKSIIRHALLQYEHRNLRLPPAGARQKITHLTERFHLFLTVRCTDRAWWEHDIWDLRADPRIPQREHEPQHQMSARFDRIEPLWLREGARFWLRTSLSSDLLRWSSVVDRARTLARHLGPFLVAAGHTHDPVISDDAPTLRLVFTEFSAWLRSPAAAANPGKRLSDSAVDATQSQTQVFYTFMVDHAPEAAAATGIARWGEVGATHTRLWGPAFRTRRAHRKRELAWYSTADLQHMLCYLDVLAADRGQHVTITHPDTTISIVAGLGDPQAARTWLLQALTGRRASEILMLDFDPLEPIAGADRPPAADTSAFVAKLRYQQTKVDGVLPTILVEQAVVNVIREQQQWITAVYPDLRPRYLFLGVRNHQQGQRHRPYPAYRASLKLLDAVHGLTDSAGHPLRFTQTHRLRHTRATELLNDGVPIHVVQRYLGHKSPEMTLHYAATLAATAESEFLRHKKIGANGVDIAMSPGDIYDMTQLSQRTDRILPNGVCLLPPLKTCDKGNACLSCGHFATDASHLAELREQRRTTEALINLRRKQFHERTGRELTDDNVWVHERLRELHSLNQIIARLEEQASATPSGHTVAGAGTGDRLPLLQIQTRGSHESTLRAAHRSGLGQAGAQGDGPS